jgi:spermidine synthase
MLFRASLYVVFILSGAAGLFYEALWARYLGLLVGNSAYAQIIVLTIFMGGMGAGALLVGARTRRLADPLAWYARVELTIGILGALFDPVFRWLMQTSYDTLLPAAGSGLPVVLVKWTVGALVILPQSFLLGTTFPLMSAGLMRRSIRLPGRTLGMLYFTNSIGAAVGVLLAGFWLLSVAGLPGTLLVATGLNVVAAAVTFVLAMRHPPTETADALDTVRDVPLTDAVRTLSRVLLGVAFGTALASFVYEVAWIRMLSLVLSSATHAFELMLSAFILGIALGAFWVRTRADTWRNPTRALGVLQCLMGAAALATLPLYGWSFEWMAALMRAFARTDGGYSAFSIGRYGISLAIMLPATFCAGTTLPLITRILLAQGAGEPAIGRVYGVNTLGSIGGAVVAGLVLLPLIGLKHTLVVGAVTDIALGVLVLAMASAAVPVTKRWSALGAAAAGLALVVVAVITPDFDPRLLASSVYREGLVPPPGSVETLFHQDGRTATVTAHRRRGVDVTIISTNGKPDASLPDYWSTPCTDTAALRPLDSDAATQTLTPLISMAYAPAARTAAVVGFGSGMSSHLLLGVPHIDSLVTIEIEPAMVRGARVFYPNNRRVYDDPRSRIVYDDAKSYFASTGRKFDFIFSEPSNPWVSGVASLFTTEFYQRISRTLTDGGVFGQWLHLYELDDGLVLSVLSAIHRNFRSYIVYQAWGADIVIVASNRELGTPSWDVFGAAGVRQDLCHNIRLAPDMLEAARILDRATLAPMLDDWGQPNSDYYPVLDLGAERTRYLRTSARGFALFAAARFDFAAALRGRALAASSDTAAPVPGIPRMEAQAVAAGLLVPHDGPGAMEADDLSRARFAHERWNARLADPTPPADWADWLDDFANVERLVHGATRGVAREGFYDTTRAFLARTGAPRSVRDVVELRHALAAWDFPAAVRTGAALAPAVERGEHLIPPEEFLDAMVTAHLKVGDRQGAQRAFHTLAPLSGRTGRDFRMLLLFSYLGADSEGSATPRELPLTGPR